MKEQSEESNLVKHAKRELAVIGMFPISTGEDPNKWMAEDILALIDVFAKQGHSGMSASCCIDLFTCLAKYEPLCPLTGEDSEWHEVGTEVWQNNRCSHVFKEADGRAYDIEGRIFREPDGCCYTSQGSRVFVEFPYTPKREYIDVPKSGCD